MHIHRSFVAAAVGALTACTLTGLGPADAATGSCEEQIGYRISSPDRFGDTGGNTVVIGLSAVTRTVTFQVHEPECTLEVGDSWSVHTAYFHAAGTYDGTAASLRDEVRLRVPGANTAVGLHQAVVSLEDSTGTENDTIDEAGLYLKRRTALRKFNVYYESPTPACGVVKGTTLHAKGRLMRASWSRDAYLPYQDRRVQLLFSAGHTAEHNLEDNIITSDVTGTRGWARIAFKPAFDANYLAH
jgi:hypothetical protein